MTKQEMAGYLASLLAIMDNIDDGGAQLRPKWVADEYQRTWEALKEVIRKEREDETRTSPNPASGAQSRTEGPRNVPGWSGPNRPSDRRPPGG